MNAARAKPPRPLDGQLSLLPDVPVAAYCRRCGLPLSDARSVARRHGPTCWRKHLADQADHAGDRGLAPPPPKSKGIPMTENAPNSGTPETTPAPRSLRELVPYLQADPRLWLTDGAAAGEPVWFVAHARGALWFEHADGDSGHVALFADREAETGVLFGQHGFVVIRAGYAARFRYRRTAP